MLYIYGGVELMTKSYDENNCRYKLDAVVSNIDENFEFTSSSSRAIDKLMSDISGQCALRVYHSDEDEAPRTDLVFVVTYPTGKVQYMA